MTGIKAQKWAQLLENRKELIFSFSCRTRDFEFKEFSRRGRYIYNWFAINQLSLGAFDPSH